MLKNDFNNYQMQNIDIITQKNEIDLEKKSKYRH